jgi:hypothetical protein
VSNSIAKPDLRPISAIIKTAMDSMRTGVINGTNYSELRLYTAILLIMSSPEYLIQK